MNNGVSVEGVCGKVVLLHGNRQTGELLLGRMDKLRKRLERQNLEIVAPSARLIFRDATQEQDDSVELRTWWNRSGNTYEGFLEDSFPQLLDLWQEEVESNERCPFVGILGFSQGARLAHLCCLANAASPNQFFPGLQFVIMVAGYEAPLPTGFQDAYLRGATGIAETSYHALVKTPSLHVWGKTDKIITPEQSRGVLPYYVNPQTYEHEGGHHVPMKADCVRVMETFIQTSRISAATTATTAATTTATAAATIELTGLGAKLSPPPPTKPDEETYQLQRDEVEALSAIFPEEFHMLSPVVDNVDYQHPIRYQVDLVKSDEGVWPPHPIAIEVNYPHNYPQESIPQIKLVHDNNMMQFSTGHADALMRAITDAAEAEQGMACVMACLYAARNFFESGAMTSVETQTKSNFEGEPTAVTDETKPSGDQPHNGLLKPSSRERIQECNKIGLEIAASVLKQMGDHLAENSNFGKGGHWTFTIGLVGKPSAGKSTFFNAATAFARQRDDSDNLLGGATMAPHPFTTIDPNIGYCLVPAPQGSCPEDNIGSVSNFTIPEVGSTHGRDHQGRRLLPVLLKDVAGLVPGAYQGRGRGNQFLNDLTDSDVLIHVLDASGTADVEGNELGIETDGTMSPEASNPLNDMSWIRSELVEWVFANLMYKWDTIKRKGRSKLTDMFGGYGQNQAVTNNVLTAVEKYMEIREGRERALDNLTMWDEGDVHRLVSAFLGVRFPMALALNKCDLPTSSVHVANILAALPIHGAHVGTPLSARKEMNFIRHHIEQSLGVIPLQSTYDATDRPEGVWTCLQSALILRAPVLVFPVNDFTHYTPLPGLFSSATSDPSLPSAGFVHCLEAAGGAAPSLWNPSTASYLGSVEHDRPLRDTLIFKPGSTVEDVFLTLKRMGALSGDFVRAEGTGAIGIPSRPIPKTQIINRNNCILKIMTNKRANYGQKK